MLKDHSASKSSIIPVILSGGAGSRLWPLSRESYPKQLLKLIGQNSLLQDTAIRAKNITPEKIIMICNEAHRFMIASQLQEIGLEAPHIILEPLTSSLLQAHDLFSAEYCSFL